MKLIAPGRALVVAMAAVATVLTACSGATTNGADGGSSSNAELRLGITTGPASLNPAKDQNNPYKMARFLTNEAVIRGRDDGTYGPGLAASFGYVGKGNKAFRFTLRHDARFSDGTPVTAAAVKSWFDYFKKASPFAAYLPVKSVTTDGRWTVTIALSSPSPDVPYLLSGPQNWGFVSSPEAVKNPSEMNSASFGAGPYVLDPSQTVAGDHYTLTPNKYYYDKSKIRWGKIVIKVISSPTSMLQALRSDQLDVAMGDISTAKAAQDSGPTVINAESGWGGIILLDWTGRLAKPLGDIRVRRAMNYAIDRKAIVAGLFGSVARPTSAFSTFDAYDPKLRNYYPYDPAKAKQLLAEAGYPDGFTLPIVTTPLNGVYGETLTQAEAKYLGQVGIKLQITSASTITEFLNKLHSGAVPAYQGIWGPDSLLTTKASFFSLKGELNPLGQHEPVIDKLAAKATVASPAAVAKTKLQIAHRIVGQAYDAPVVTWTQPFYVTKRVGGVLLNRFFGSAPVMAQWYPKG